MRVRLQYGTDGLDVTVPGREVTVLSPLFVPGLPDEESAFLEAVRRHDQHMGVGNFGH